VEVPKNVDLPRSLKNAQELIREKDTEEKKPKAKT